MDFLLFEIPSINSKKTLGHRSLAAPAAHSMEQIAEQYSNETNFSAVILVNLNLRLRLILFHLTYN